MIKFKTLEKVTLRDINDPKHKGFLLTDGDTSGWVYCFKDGSGYTTLSSEFAPEIVKLIKENARLKKEIALLKTSQKEKRKR